jgi:hypothetical protein
MAQYSEKVRPDLEKGWCPNCGNEGLLDSWYGWCVSCVASVEGRKACPVCDARIIHVDESACYICRKAAGGVNQRSRAFDIEAQESIKKLQRSEKLTHKQARKLFYESRRPICRCCGRPIYRGKHNSKFCKESPECKSAQDRYQSLRRVKRRTEEEAIREVLNGITLATIDIREAV